MSKRSKLTRRGSSKRIEPPREDREEENEKRMESQENKDRQVREAAKVEDTMTFNPTSKALKEQWSPTHHIFSKLFVQSSSCLHIDVTMHSHHTAYTGTVGRGKPLLLGWAFSCIWSRCFFIRAWHVPRVVNQLKVRH